MIFCLKQGKLGRQDVRYTNVLSICIRLKHLVSKSDITIVFIFKGEQDVTWVDMPRHPKRQSEFPNTHSVSKFYPTNNTDRYLSENLPQYRESDQ